MFDMFKRFFVKYIKTVILSDIDFCSFCKLSYSALYKILVPCKHLRSEVCLLISKPTREPHIQYDLAVIIKMTWVGSISL